MVKTILQYLVLGPDFSSSGDKTLALGGQKGLPLQDSRILNEIKEKALVIRSGVRPNRCNCEATKNVGTYFPLNGIPIPCSPLGHLTFMIATKKYTRPSLKIRRLSTKTQNTNGFQLFDE